MLDATHCPARCEYCGDDRDVTNRREYVGGQGYCSSTQCVDKRACAHRQDLYAVVDGLLSLTPGFAPGSEASRLTNHRRALA